jgi:malonate-semialdehyde dehydrogenase (acetylating)/methylmalonate-semialdehyde dehydrogenase
MIGVNVGIPVPREPFSFGGMGASRFGSGGGDITGDGLVNLVTRVRKITTRWISGLPQVAAGPVDRANFNGRQ